MGNPLCHWEFMVNDVEKSKAFYGKVFDWEFDESSYPGYCLVKTGKDPEGGMMKKPPEAPCTSLSQYFLVDDIDATLAKAQELGASVALPKMEIPNVGFAGMFVDPDGIPVGLFETKK